MIALRSPLRHPLGLRLLVAGCLLLGAATTAGGAAATTAGAGSGPAVGCAWFGETDQRDVNIGAPDLDAHYWLAPLVISKGSGATISGVYPRARYFSLTLYNEQTTPIGSLYDKHIRPAHGSSNPYRAKPRPGTARRYTVHVVFGPRPKHPAANTMYANPKLGSVGVPAVLLEYRVYVSTNPASPQGGVPWPTITTTVNGKPSVEQGPCSVTPPSFGAPLWEAAANANYPADGPTSAVAGASRIPLWTRQFGNQFGNPQNAYLATTISRQYGPLVVIHTRVPTFPNNRRGVPAYVKRQIRYWSICTYDANGEFVFGCAADDDATIRHHYITYVISDPDARPASANAAHGVTWLPWGGIQSSGQIVYRNMLPAKSFHHAAQAITRPGQSANKLMGRYYPHAVYCTTKRFTGGGWKACFKAAR